MEYPFNRRYSNAEPLAEPDRRNFAALAVLLKDLYGLESPAAGRLAQDVRPWKYRKEITMSNEQVAPETKGVTVKLLATVDLGP
jgi:hypothetical protein